MSPKPRPVEILIGDDDDLVREAMAEVIRRQANMKVVGLARDAEEVVEQAGSLNPQVVVVDLKMPKGGGLAAIKSMAQMPNRPKILAVSAYDDASIETEARRLGASGYLVKGGPKEELISAILGLLDPI